MNPPFFAFLIFFMVKIICDMEESHVKEDSVGPTMLC